MKVSRSYTLPYSRDQVVRVLCDPAFNVEREQLRDGVVACEFRGGDEVECNPHFEVHTTERKRTLMGGFAPSGTVNTLTKFHCNASEGTVSWQYSGEAAALMELSGVYTLVPKEGGTELKHEARISVWIPVLGYYIERHIAGEFEKADRKYLDLIHCHLKDSTRYRV